jgi:hypothetical protein
MDTQRNFTRSLIQEFFTFQHLHHYTHLPYHQHIHPDFSLLLTLFLHLRFSFLFQLMDHHKLHRIHSVVGLHHHHL